MVAPDSHPNPPALTFAERLRVGRQLASWKVSEFFRFDSRLVNWIAAWSAFALAGVLLAMGRKLRALESLTAAHRANGSRTVCSLTERILRQPPDPNSQLSRSVNGAYDEFLAGVTVGEGKHSPANLIGSRLIVVKSSAENERGVLFIDYTYTFPLFAKCCDLAALARRYYIVLEPSWVGYCTPEILLYSRLGEPVFVETNETPDRQAIEGVSPNLIALPTVSNWWMDQRIIQPVAVERKEFDLSMVSSWMPFKRHARVFAAMQRLRRRGTKLRALLIGYPIEDGFTRDDLFRQAQYFGVSDQIEIREWLKHEEMAAELSRSKCHVVWSRREGSNRAIIESMLADVPSILRQGFNFGQHYPYINPQTGRFADEQSLPEELLYMREHYREFHPRAWVLDHMTPQVATGILNDTIKRVALARGEAWTTDLVVRTKHLHRAGYWNPDDEARFAADYAYIRSLLRPETRVLG